MLFLRMRYIAHKVALRLTPAPQCTKTRSPARAALSIASNAASKCLEMFSEGTSVKQGCGP